MSIGDVISWVFKLKFLEKYRTKIGAVALLAGGLLTTMQTPDFIAAFDWAADLPAWLVGAGTYLGIIGARYKDEDPK